MIVLARCTSATSTISIAQTLSRRARPALVPLTTASIVLEATGSGSINSPAVCCSLVSGTMMRLMRIAAGAPSTEAMMKWAAASGTRGPTIVA